jgi:plasmid stabilization system protein ParE
VSKREPRLRRTAQAEEDLIDIWAYIARDNPAAADRLLDILDEKSQALAHNAQIGMARDDVAVGVRHSRWQISHPLSRSWGLRRSSALRPWHAPSARFVLTAPPIRVRPP